MEITDTHTVRYVANVSAIVTDSVAFASRHAGEGGVGDVHVSSRQFTLTFACQTICNLCSVIYHLAVNHVYK